MAQLPHPLENQEPSEFSDDSLPAAAISHLQTPTPLRPQTYGTSPAVYSVRIR